MQSLIMTGDQSGQMDIMAQHVTIGNYPLNDVTEISASLPEIRKRNPMFVRSTPGFFTIVYEADLPDPG